VIQLSSLTKSFGDRALLEDVTWQISTGERVGLCGPNGAGKTTLLKMLAGFDEPDSGCRTVCSTRAARSSTRRARHLRACWP
jgi:ATPase subunit of ABC transporter with duplicated ATPase domains